MVDGSNDGMLHAVLDLFDPDIEDPNDVISHYGRESWAFISPDHLPRLKEIVEGTGHQYFIDSSPQVYIRDVNENGILEDNVDADGDGDIDDDDKDRVIIVCGQRKGGTSYFALDVTVPINPVFLWRISANSAFAPDVQISELGESWSEPRFGRVKTTDTDTIGTPVFFIGGGFSADNTAGKAVIAIDVFTGTALVFPNSDENINSWNGHVLLRAPTYVYNSVTTPRKFYYPPSVTLERSYDLVLIGSGDREMACANDTAADRIYSMRDTHAYVTLTESDLVDVTNPVPVLTSKGQKLLVSVGSALPVAGSESIEAGILGIDPLAPDLNFYYIWWREL